MRLLASLLPVLLAGTDTLHMLHETDDDTESLRQAVDAYEGEQPGWTPELHRKAAPDPDLLSLPHAVPNALGTLVIPRRNCRCDEKTGRREHRAVPAVSPQGLKVPNLDTLKETSEQTGGREFAPRSHG
jgi:hypothetical protein